MPFRLWHILGKFFAPILFAVVTAGILFDRTPGVERVWVVAVASIVVLGMTGAAMGVLMALGRLRMRCPFCGTSGPAGANKQDGMWMTCERCGYIHSAGPAGWRIVCDPAPPE